MSCVITNTNSPNCTFTPNPDHAFIRTPRFDSNGNENKIPDTVVFNSAFVEAQLNAVDPLARWYPITGIKNIAPSASDPDQKTYTDKSKDVVGYSIVLMAYIVANATKTNARFYDQCNCQEWCEYKVDKNGTITGYSKGGGDNSLYPFVISKGSLTKKEMPAVNGTNTFELDIKYDYTPEMNLSNIGFISSESIGFNINLKLTGLVDYVMTKVSRTTTTLVLKFEHPTGATLVADRKFYGFLVAADFKDQTGAYGVTGATGSVLWDKTANANVAISNVAFNSATGEYTLTIASTPLINVLSANPVKTGFDFNNAKLVSL